MKKAKPLRVLLGEGQPLFRKGMRETLSQMDGVEVVGEADNSSMLLRLVKETRPDLVMTTFLFTTPTYHDFPGLKIAESIRKRRPACGVVLIFPTEDQCQYDLVRGAQAYGCMHRSITSQELGALVRGYQKGAPFKCPSMTTGPSQTAKDREIDAVNKTRTILTAREYEVLNLVVGGCTSREVAEKLHISSRTVESHRLNIMAKTGVSSVAELTRYAILAGLYGRHASYTSPG